uniref:ARID DNA-binding domain-containing protein n=1 Tax=Tanacetum cinerariifolium TaxID=118510 RepID=A0A6L2MWW0_TANCI|nr:ARID DNA-binding domain-containing protein [Tanacetum cinerariifolium]
MLKENLKEIEAFNASSVCAAFKRKSAKTVTRKEKRARCFICKERGHVLWKCPNKKNKNRGETSKPSFDEKLKYPEVVHVKTDYMVEGSDEQNWNKIWYVGSVYKNHMSPTKSLFKRLKNSFKVLDKEEDERKFIFSYGVGEAIVETKDGALEYFESIDPTVKCSLIKGMEDLKMEKEDVQDYIDDEYLSMNGTLYAMKKFMEMLEWFYLGYLGQDVLGELPPVIGVIKVDLLGLYKFVDDLGGYMNVSFNNKWNEIAKLLGLAQENQEVVKECYKEFIGMVKIYYEEAKRSKQERPGKEVVGNDRGTVGLKEPQAFAGMNAEIGNSLNGNQERIAQNNVKDEGSNSV